MHDAHCSLKVLQWEHRMLDRHLRALKRQLAAGRWRWPGAAQDQLRRRLRVLQAHQRGQHRFSREARLARRRADPAGRRRVPQVMVDTAFLLPRETAGIGETLGLLEALREGDRTAVAPIVSSVLVLGHALSHQLEAESRWLQALAIATPVSTREQPVARLATATRTPRRVPLAAGAEARPAALRPRKPA